MARPPGSTRTPTKSAVKERRREAEIAWINWLNEVTKKTDSALAVMAGQSANTITRFRDREGALLDGLTILMLSEATGLPGPDTYLLEGADKHLEDAEPYESKKGAEPLLQQLIDLALKGRTNASPWRLRTRAIEKLGYMPGDIVIVDKAQPHRAGEAVAAQVFTGRDTAPRVIFRVAEPPYLISMADDPSARKPLLIDDQSVIILGPIVHSFRTRK